MPTPEQPAASTERLREALTKIVEDNPPPGNDFAADAFWHAQRVAEEALSSAQGHDVDGLRDAFRAELRAWHAEHKNECIAWSEGQECCIEKYLGENLYEGPFNDPD